MQQVFRTLEDGKIGILESPTGTVSESQPDLEGRQEHELAS